MSDIKYCNVDKLAFYIINPDDIDAIKTTLPQGEIRKAIMEINHCRRRIKELEAYPTEAAYLAVCKANDEKRETIKELEDTLSKVKNLLERENTRQFIIDVIKTETARQHATKEASDE